MKNTFICTNILVQLHDFGKGIAVFAARSWSIWKVPHTYILEWAWLHGPYCIFLWVNDSDKVRWDFVGKRVSGHNGHKPKGQKPKRPQTEKATDRSGHKPERPQTGTASNRNDHKPERPQTEKATNWNGHKLNGHKSSNINCIETWSHVDFFGQFYIHFCQLHSCFFSLYVCHYWTLPFVSGSGLLIIWHNIYSTEPFDSW